MQLRRLPGGASRETWAVEVEDRPGNAAGCRRYVLRRDPPGAPSRGMGREAALIRAAAAHGVPVPPIVAAGDDARDLGAPFVLMEHVAGETIPRKLLRDDEFAAARPLLARQCGGILARLHAVPPEGVPGLEDQDQVAQFRAVLDSLGRAQPALELGFRWLAANRPAARGRVVVHGDFRNGNLIVGPDGVRAVLDWELAHLGDPLEDLGWFCVKSWRFGSPLPAGGFGTYDDLIAGYEEGGGAKVDRDALRWWEVVGNVKWAVMCMIQAETHLSGAVRSVELAAIGRRVAEVEWDLLHLLDEDGG